ncbi:aminotransferase [Novosphingobium sp.]|uniref:aminotransferase n=1 Tax=Novosphingobium sp. TaxID=1874826 RepID=UPI00286E47C8|nr:aminotransferase [Novosphingobium sp.]
MELNPIYSGMGVTIFEKMSALCRDGSRINLGQGFPDDSGPAQLLAAAGKALLERSNQYPPSPGVPELRDAVAAWYRRSQHLDLLRENVIVTSGATEALAAAILASVSPGDEVILFAPVYDAYAPLVRRAGGKPVFVTLRPPDWRYDNDAIEAVITERTRAIILNDPLNPTGTCASDEELTTIAQVCIRHDLLAICDEVWESVRFDGQVQRSLLSFPGMAQRTIKIGSAGKIFGVTGWKIGWLCAAPALASVLARVHQFLTFTTPPALQYAVAEGLASDALIDERKEGWARTRTFLNSALRAAGFSVLPNQATWFTCVDLPGSGFTLDDAAFAERAVHEGMVASIPVSAFYEADAVTSVLRLCHCKAESTLAEGVTRLARFRDALASH